MVTKNHIDQALTAISNATDSTTIVDIVNELAKRVNYPIQSDGLPYAEAAQNMRNAHLDLKDFSALCYEKKSLEELITLKKQPVNKTDCNTWNLDANEYNAAIELALLAKQGDFLADVLEAAENRWFDIENES